MQPEYVVEVNGHVRERTHVKYCIVTTAADGRQWQVYRRFRDLLELHTLLRSTLGDSRAQLPTRRAYGFGKLIFGQEQDVDFILERQHALQTYLNSTLAVDTSLSSGVRLFLGLPALPDYLSLEPELCLPSDVGKWKTRSKFDLRLLRTLFSSKLSTERKAHLVDVPLSVLELHDVAQTVSHMAGTTVTCIFRAASRAVAESVRRSLPGLLASTARIYVSCSWQGRPPALSLFHPRTRTFDDLTAPLSPYSALASRRGDLFVLTAEDHVGNSGTAWSKPRFLRFDAMRHQWHPLPPRPGESTTRFALAAAGSGIYAVGGMSRRGVVGLVHRFDVGTGTWEALPPMACPRCDIATAICGGEVFVIGGTETSGEASSKVECLSVEACRWRSAPPLLGPRHSASAASLGADLFVFGGGAVARDHLLADAVSPPVAERFAEGCWQALEITALRRHGCGAAAAAGQVFVFGGYSSDFADVDRWDSEAKQWDILPLPARLRGVCAAAAAVS